MPIHKTLNQDFFKVWSEDMAYVLGFFAADGNMIRNKRGAHFVEFQITDRHIVFDIRRTIGSNHKITVRTRNGNQKTIFRLQIGSATWFTDLISRGFVPAKSKVLVFPKVPRKYIGPFIRGYFDGDGSVYFKKYKSKDRVKPRWVFSSRFTSGSRVFLETLLHILRKHGVSGGFILTKSKQSGFDLVLSHRDSLALYCLMYNNAPRIYLMRKYRVFRTAVETLYGNGMRS